MSINPSNLENTNMPSYCHKQKDKGKKQINVIWGNKPFEKLAIQSTT